MESVKQRRRLKRAFFPGAFFLPAALALAALTALAAPPADAAAESAAAAKLNPAAPQAPAAEISAKQPAAKKPGLSIQGRGGKAGSEAAGKPGKKQLPGKPAAARASAEKPEKPSAAGAPAPGAPGAKKSAKKSKRKRKAAKGAPERQISAAPRQNIDAEFQERLEALSAICGESSKSAESRLAMFADVLDQWAQWIYGKKTAGRLKLQDRSLLNDILDQLQDLPYRKIISEESSPKRAAELIGASFEHNFRYNYNLSEGSVISPAWARAILKTLACIDPGRAERPA